jgi:hypothetical protein
MSRSVSTLCTLVQYWYMLQAEDHEGAHRRVLVSAYIVYTCAVLVSVVCVLQAEDHEGAHLHVQVSE